MVTGPWRCDVCQKEIASPEYGLIEWLVRGAEAHGLRLVHGLVCSYGAQAQIRGISDRPLESFLGTDGLVRLLALTDRLPVAEVREMIQRLHVPGFERARLLAADARAAGIVDPKLPEGFYLRSEIKAILDWAEERSRPERLPRIGAAHVGAARRNVGRSGTVSLRSP